MSQQPLLSWVGQTMAGLEDVLRDELEAIGIEGVFTHNRAVSFKATLHEIYRAHLEVRTALRFLIPIAEEQVMSEDELYAFATSVSWGDFMAVDQTFSITANLSKSFLTHTLFAAQKVKDAIVDQFREIHGQRPNVDIKNPDQKIYLHVHQNRATLLLDASGDGLHKRGYRLPGALAPVNEVLASGLLKLAGWQPGTPLLDPMCGSGSILVEAARMAAGLPVVSGPPRFTFMKWGNFDSNAWSDALRLSKSYQNLNYNTSIIGRDIDSFTLNLAADNAANAGIKNLIHFESGSFFEMDPPADSGIIIINPPYDDRIPIGQDPIEFYKEIGHTLKKKYAGWKALIFSGNLEGMKWFGLKPDKKHILFNGAIECRAQTYSLFVGKLK